MRPLFSYHSYLHILTPQHCYYISYHSLIFIYWRHNIAITSLIILLSSYIDATTLLLHLLSFSYLHLLTPQHCYYISYHSLIFIYWRPNITITSLIILLSSSIDATTLLLHLVSFSYLRILTPQHYYYISYHSLIFIYWRHNIAITSLIILLSSSIDATTLLLHLLPFSYLHLLTPQHCYYISYHSLIFIYWRHNIAITSRIILLSSSIDAPTLLLHLLSFSYLHLLTPQHCYYISYHSLIFIYWRHNITITSLIILLSSSIDATTLLLHLLPFSYLHLLTPQRCYYISYHSLIFIYWRHNIAITSRIILLSSSIDAPTLLLHLLSFSYLHLLTPQHCYYISYHSLIFIYWRHNITITSLIILLSSSIDATTLLLHLLSFSYLHLLTPQHCYYISYHSLIFIYWRHNIAITSLTILLSSSIDATTLLLHLLPFSYLHLLTPQHCYYISYHSLIFIYWRHNIAITSRIILLSSYIDATTLLLHLLSFSYLHLLTPQHCYYISYHSLIFIYWRHNIAITSLIILLSSSIDATTLLLHLLPFSYLHLLTPQHCYYISYHSLIFIYWRHNIAIASRIILSSSSIDAPTLLLHLLSFSYLHLLTPQHCYYISYHSLIFIYWRHNITITSLIILLSSSIDATTLLLHLLFSYLHLLTPQHCYYISYHSLIFIYWRHNIAITSLTILLSSSIDATTLLLHLLPFSYLHILTPQHCYYISYHSLIFIYWRHNIAITSRIILLSSSVDAPTLLLHLLSFSYLHILTPQHCYYISYHSLIFIYWRHNITITSLIILLSSSIDATTLLLHLLSFSYLHLLTPQHCYYISYHSLIFIYWRHNIAITSLTILLSSSIDATTLLLHLLPFSYLHLLTPQHCYCISYHSLIFIYWRPNITITSLIILLSSSIDATTLLLHLVSFSYLHILTPQHYYYISYHSLIFIYWRHNIAITSLIILLSSSIDATTLLLHLVSFSYLHLLTPQHCYYISYHSLIFIYWRHNIAITSLIILLSSSIDATTLLLHLVSFSYLHILTPQHYYYISYHSLIFIYWRHNITITSLIILLSSSIDASTLLLHLLSFSYLHLLTPQHCYYISYHSLIFIYWRHDIAITSRIILLSPSIDATTLLLHLVSFSYLHLLTPQHYYYISYHSLIFIYWRHNIDITSRIILLSSTIDATTLLLHLLSFSYLHLLTPQHCYYISYHSLIFIYWRPNITITSLIILLSSSIDATTLLLHLVSFSYLHILTPQHYYYISYHSLIFIYWRHNIAITSLIILLSSSIDATTLLLHLLSFSYLHLLTPQHCYYISYHSLIFIYWRHNIAITSLTILLSSSIDATTLLLHLVSFSYLHLLTPQHYYYISYHSLIFIYWRHNIAITSRIILLSSYIDATTLLLHLLSFSYLHLLTPQHCYYISYHSLIFIYWRHNIAITSRIILLSSSIDATTLLLHLLSFSYLHLLTPQHCYYISYHSLIFIYWRHNIAIASRIILLSSSIDAPTLLLHLLSFSYLHLLTPQHCYYISYHSLIFIYWRHNITITSLIILLSSSIDATTLLLHLVSFSYLHLLTPQHCYYISYHSLIFIYWRHNIAITSLIILLSSSIDATTLLLHLLSFSYLHLLTPQHCYYISYHSLIFIYWRHNITITSLTILLSSSIVATTLLLHLLSFSYLHLLTPQHYYYISYHSLIFIYWRPNIAITSLIILLSSSIDATTLLLQ